MSHPTSKQDPGDRCDAVGTSDSVGDAQGDLYEMCCPHCGFCGDEHKFDCADCIDAGLPAALPSSALSRRG